MSSFDLGPDPILQFYSSLHSNKIIINMSTSFRLLKNIQRAITSMSTLQRYSLPAAVKL